MKFLDILTLKRRRCDHTYVYLNKESVGASYGCDVLFHDEYYVKCLECGREVRCFSAEQVLRLVTKLDKKVITQTKQNVKEVLEMEKPCFECGHYLIGLGCCVKGVNDYEVVDLNDTCDKWIEEGNPGSVTYFEEQSDGMEWKDEEFIKDDMTNL